MVFKFIELFVYFFVNFLNSLVKFMIAILSSMFCGSYK